MLPIARTGVLLTEEAKNHLAYNLSLEQLEVVVVDDSRLNQTITRTFLQSMRMRRMRFYEDAAQAMREMVDDTPHLLIASWQVKDVPGQRLLKLLRNKRMGSLALLPVLITMATPTRREAEKAYRYGAQAIIAKPFSLMGLQKRIQWILEDSRTLSLEGETYTIDGVHKHLAAIRDKQLGDFQNAIFMSNRAKMQTAAEAAIA